MVASNFSHQQKKTTKKLNPHTFIKVSNYYVRKFWFVFSCLLIFTVLASLITIIIPLIIKMHIQKMTDLTNEFITNASSHWNIDSFYAKKKQLNAILGKGIDWSDITKIEDIKSKLPLGIDPDFFDIGFKKYNESINNFIDSILNAFKENKLLKNLDIIKNEFKKAKDILKSGFDTLFLNILKNNTENKKSIREFISTIFKDFLVYDLRWIAIKMILYITSCIVLLGIFIFIKEFAGYIWARKIEIDYRKRVFNHLLNLDMKFYEKHHSGDTLTKLINDTSTVSLNIRDVPTTLINGVFTFIGALATMFWINPLIASIVIGFTFFILIFCSIIFLLIKKHKRLERSVYGDLNAYALDRINIIRLIKANGTQEIEKTQFANTHKLYYKVGKKLDYRDSSAIAFFISLVRSVSLVSLLSLVGYTVALGNIGPEKMRNLGIDMLTFIMLTSTLVMPIFQIVSLFSRVIVIIISVERLENILSLKSGIIVKKDSYVVKKIENGIQFNNVTFGYIPETNIIENFSFHFKNNQSYAIVGETGSGKTTITKLILRFYDPQNGQIIVNGHDLRNIELNSFLKNVGYIEQEPNIFSSSFFENIRYVKQDATLDEVIEATKKANLHQFIMSTKNKYDTQIGEKGFILSGGQKQRILIARMFLKNPQILILDEATSSLDNIVEKEIQKELNLLMKNRTTIVIAHRLSTIKNVDQIIVLSKEKAIAQIGSFNELKNIDGHFKDLYLAGLME